MTTEDNKYLLTEEAIGFAGMLLDDHDNKIETSDKVRAIIFNIYKQLILSQDYEAYVLGSDNNIKALESCLDEPISKSAEEIVNILYESACAIHNGW